MWYSHLPQFGIKMAKTKKILRRAWSKEDVRQLKTMAKTKVGVTKISKALKRTTSATMAKASVLGVSLDTRG
jgi:hypothetical protein